MGEPSVSHGAAFLEEMGCGLKILVLKRLRRQAGSREDVSCGYFTSSLAQLTTHIGKNSFPMKHRYTQCTSTGAIVGPPRGKPQPLTGPQRLAWESAQPIKAPRLLALVLRNHCASQLNLPPSTVTSKDLIPSVALHVCQ